MPPKKATSEQNKTLVNLIEKSGCIRWGKGTPEQKKECWENIAATLNALGGVTKDPEGWKKAYTEMKSHIKAKIRAGKSLNEIERKCAEISGLLISCVGMENVPELGLGGNTVEENLVIEITGEEASGMVQDQEEHPEVVVIEPLELDETSNQAGISSQCKLKKKIGNKPEKPLKLLLSEHITNTDKGLQEIAMSIQAVAEAINDVALAIRESKLEDNN